MVARAIKVQPPKYRLLAEEREIADFRITCLSTAAAVSLEVVHSDVPASLNQADYTFKGKGVKSSFEFGRAYHIHDTWMVSRRVPDVVCRLVCRGQL